MSSDEGMRISTTDEIRRPTRIATPWPAGVTSSFGVAVSSRRFGVSGERPVFHVWYRPTEEGYEVDLVDLPARIRVTGRKGIERAARDRIVLQLELPEDAFDVQIRPAPRRRSRRTSRADTGG
jgi:hypothetical protein